MFTAYIIVTVLTVAANAYAAVVDFRRPQWVLDNMSKWGGSDSWLSTLGALKAVGALGRLVGIGIPLIGVAAGVGLVLFFVGAIAVVCLLVGTRTFHGRRLISYWRLRRSQCGSQCRENVFSSDKCRSFGALQNFWEMSKQVNAKRHHCEGPKFCGPTTTKNEIRRGKAK